MFLQGFPMNKAERHYKRFLNDKDKAARNRSQEKWQIVNHHFENNTFFRSKIGQIPERWEDIPILTKKDLQSPLEALLSRPYQPNAVYIGNTSGSSGHPFFYAKDKLCHALTWIEIKRLYELHGITLSSRQARFYGIPLDKKGNRLEKWKDAIANRLRFPVFDLSEQVLDGWIEKFRKESFDYIYGYASSLTYFARYLSDKGLVLKDICPSLRLCISTSEACTSQDRKILEAGFGVKLVNEYGASEVGLIAFEDREGAWRICEDLLYVEVTDEDGMPVEDGQPGRLLITALYNKAMPIIRYQIGDVGVLKNDAKGNRILVSLEGRTNDFIQLPSGKTSPGLTMYYVSRSLLENAGFIKEFIIRQTALDTLVFDIHSSYPIGIRERQLIQDKMKEYLEPGLNLVIRQVDKIERPDSGKIKHFYSEI